MPSLKRWAVRDPAGPDPVDQGRRRQGGRSQDLPDPAQGADRHHARRRWASPPSIVPFIMPKRVAETDAFKQIEDYTGSGPVHLREGRVEARRQDGLRQEPQVQAARRAGLGPGRRQDGQARPGRMGRDPRPADGDERAAQGRDRHDRDAAARPLQGHGGRSATSSWSTLNKWGNQYIFRFNQLFKPFDNPKVRQAAALRLQPEGLSRRRDRRSQVLQGLQGDVHVRHALSPAPRASRTSSTATSPRPRSS